MKRSQLSHQKHWIAFQDIRNQAMKAPKYQPSWKEFHKYHGIGSGFRKVIIDSGLMADLDHMSWLVPDMDLNLAFSIFEKAYDDYRKADRDRRNQFNKASTEHPGAKLHRAIYGLQKELSQ